MSRKSIDKVRRRKRRIKKGKQNNELKRWVRSRIHRDVSMVVDHYARGHKTLPYSTLLEAVSQENPENNDTIRSVFESSFKDLGKRVENTKNSRSLAGARFKSIISFLIPLDFFMPVPEPYYTGGMYVNGKTIVYASFNMSKVCDAQL